MPKPKPILTKKPILIEKAYWKAGLLAKHGKKNSRKPSPMREKLLEDILARKNRVYHLEGKFALHKAEKREKGIHPVAGDVIRANKIKIEQLKVLIVERYAEGYPLTDPVIEGYLKNLKSVQNDIKMLRKGLDSNPPKKIFLKKNDF